MNYCLNIVLDILFIYVFLLLPLVYVCRLVYICFRFSPLSSNPFLSFSFLFICVSVIHSVCLLIKYWVYRGQNPLLYCTPNIYEPVSFLTLFRLTTPVNFSIAISFLFFPSFGMIADWKAYIMFRNIARSDQYIVSGFCVGSVIFNYIAFKI